jgi:hypothetical protein
MLLFAKKTDVESNKNTHMEKMNSTEERYNKYKAFIKEESLDDYYNNHSNSNIVRTEEKEERLDTNDDLLIAIKQVAKEMAEAVRTSTKKPDEDDEEEEEDNFAEGKINEEDLKEKSRIIPQYKQSNQRYHEENLETEISKKSFYEREVEAFNKLQQKLELQRNKKHIEEIKNLQHKPELSSATKKIIQDKLADKKPIHERLYEELDIKNRHHDKLKESAYELEKSKESKYISKYNVGVGDKNKIEKFISSQMEWKRNKERKLSEVKIEIEKIHREATKELFRPNILKASEKIAIEKNKKLKYKDVHSRLYNQHGENIRKREILQTKNAPSFKPNINKSIPKFKEIFDRKTERPCETNHSKIRTVSQDDKMNIKYVDSLEEDFDLDMTNHNELTQAYKENLETLSSHFPNKNQKNETPNLNLYRVNISNRESENKILATPKFNAVMKSLK